MSFIECKRYGPKNPVGVEILRALRGTADLKRATFSAVVTTSHFTKGAKEFAQKLPHQMALHDFDRLQERLGTVAKKGGLR